MVKGTEQQGSDGRDNKRVFRWGIAAVAVLIVAALVFNAFFPHSDSAPAKADTSQQRTPDPLGNQAPK